MGRLGGKHRDRRPHGGGEITAYVRDKCRCNECVVAWRAYQRKWQWSWRRKKKLELTPAKIKKIERLLRLAEGRG